MRRYGYWLVILGAVISPAEAIAQDAIQAGAPRALSLEVAVGTGIVSRQLTGTADAFPLTASTLYCYMKVSNAANAQIEHVWYREKTEMSRVTLSIGGSPWRSWSVRKLEPGMTGNWRCDVVKEGRVLRSVAFRVE